MRLVLFVLPLTLAVVLGAACGGGSSGPTSPNYTGSYVGKVKFRDPANPGNFSDSTSITADIQHPEGSNQLTGSWSTPFSSGGLLATVHEGGTTMAFVLQQAQPCFGEFSGNAGQSTLDGRFVGIGGQYQGTDCNGATQATVDLTVLP